MLETPKNAKSRTKSDVCFALAFSWEPKRVQLCTTLRPIGGPLRSFWCCGWGRRLKPLPGTAAGGPRRSVSVRFCGRLGVAVKVLQIMVTVGSSILPQKVFGAGAPPS